MSISLKYFKINATKKIEYIFKNLGMKLHIRHEVNLLLCLFIPLLINHYKFESCYVNVNNYVDLKDKKMLGWEFDF